MEPYQVDIIQQEQFQRARGGIPVFRQQDKAPDLLNAQRGII